MNRCKTSSDKPGLLFVVAAPSGAGKTSICRELLKRLEADGDPELRWSCSYTTRKPRAGEQHGRDYFFVDDPAFDKMIAGNEFVEWAHVHGRRYGTSKAYLEQARDQGVDLLLEIDIQGARSLKEQNLEARFVFVLPPSWAALEARLRGRGTEAEEEVQRRLTTAKKEMLEWQWFHYIIVNDEFNRAVDRLRAIVLSARAGREVMACEVTKILAHLEK